jgi:hypothetical protein
MEEWVRDGLGAHLASVAGGPLLAIHIINAITGEIFRALTLDPIKDYQPRTKKTADRRGFNGFLCPET